MTVNLNLGSSKRYKSGRIVRTGINVSMGFGAFAVIVMFFLGSFFVSDINLQISLASPQNTNYNEYINYQGYYTSYDVNFPNVSQYQQPLVFNETHFLKNNFPTSGYVVEEYSDYDLKLIQEYGGDGCYILPSDRNDLINASSQVTSLNDFIQPISGGTMGDINTNFTVNFQDTNSDADSYAGAEYVQMTVNSTQENLFHVDFVVDSDDGSPYFYQYVTYGEHPTVEFTPAGYSMGRNPACYVRVRNTEIDVYMKNTTTSDTNIYTSGVVSSFNDVWISFTVRTWVDYDVVLGKNVDYFATNLYVPSHSIDENDYFISKVRAEELGLDNASYAPSGFKGMSADGLNVINTVEYASMYKSKPRFPRGGTVNYSWFIDYLTEQSAYVRPFYQNSSLDISTLRVVGGVGLVSGPTYPTSEMLVIDSTGVDLLDLGTYGYAYDDYYGSTYTSDDIWISTQNEYHPNQLRVLGDFRAYKGYRKYQGVAYANMTLTTNDFDRFADLNPVSLTDNTATSYIDFYSAVDNCNITVSLINSVMTDVVKSFTFRNAMYNAYYQTRIQEPYYYSATLPASSNFNFVNGTLSALDDTKTIYIPSDGIITVARSIGGFQTICINLYSTITLLSNPFILAILIIGVIFIIFKYGKMKYQRSPVYQRKNQQIYNIKDK